MNQERALRGHLAGRLRTNARSKALLATLRNSYGDNSSVRHCMKLWERKKSKCLSKIFSAITNQNGGMNKPLHDLSLMLQIHRYFMILYLTRYLAKQKMNNFKIVPITDFGVSKAVLFYKFFILSPSHDQFLHPLYIVNHPHYIHSNRALFSRRVS